MKRPAIFPVFMLVILLAACNLPSAGGTGGNGGATQPPAVPPTQTSGPAAPAETSTDTPQPLPTDTPTITLTPTPSTPMVAPNTEAVNCRFGPGTSYLGIGGLMPGMNVPILGQNGDGSWWQIQNPNDITNKCWVTATATTTSGNTASVPVVSAPLPFVTKAVANNPPTVTVPGCIGPIAPIALTGTITTNGPVSVTFHFETQPGGALASHTLTFTKFGAQNVTDNSFTPPAPLSAGTYWVKLVITAPNSVTAQASYTIACP